MLQERIPNFLGYHENIEMDKNFLLSKLKQNEIPEELKIYIYKNTSL